MKLKHLRTIAAALFLGVCATANAYDVDFNATIDVSEHDFKVAAGWGHIVGTTKDYREKDFYPSYTYESSAGVSSTGCLKVKKQSTYVNISTREEAEVQDLLVTPAVSGNIYIYVKANSAGNPEIRFYTVTEDENGTLTAGDQITIDEVTLSTSDFVKVSLPEQTEKVRIGIWGNQVYMDDFHADEAEVTEVVTMLGITNLEPIENNGVEQKDGTVKIGYKVTIKNTGTTDLKVGDEGYSLSLLPYTSESGEGDVLTTVEIKEDLAAGEEITVEVVWETTNSGSASTTSTRYDVRENISNTMAKGSEFIKITAYAPTVVIGETGYGTFYSSRSWSLPSSINYYYTATVSDTIVTLNEVGSSYVPKNTGIIVEGTPGEYKMTTPTGTAPTISNNDLSGAEDELTVESGATYYCLTYKGSQTYFAPVAEGVTIPANKAFFDGSKVTVTPGAARLVIGTEEDGKTTAIKNSLSIDQEDAIYTLDGVKVANPTKKGIYIRGNKKFIVK